MPTTLKLSMRRATSVASLGAVIDAIVCKEGLNRPLLTKAIASSLEAMAGDLQRLGGAEVARVAMCIYDLALAAPAMPFERVAEIGLDIYGSGRPS